LLVLAGVGVMGWPMLHSWWRNRDAEAAVRSWPIASANLVNALPGDPQGPEVPAQGDCSSQPPAGDFALVSFLSLDRYGYKGAAVDGTWDLLASRQMVHHRNTPSPGERGNVIIAFHREPAYLHIDELVPGDLVSVQDRNCRLFVYRITQRWQLLPSQVEQLNPTSGYDLTLVTCTPWYRDNERLVWRATLVTADLRL
jgi:sortase A